jgi:hypothetical protein
VCTALGSNRKVFREGRQLYNMCWLDCWMQTPANFYLACTKCHHIFILSPFSLVLSPQAAWLSAGPSCWPWREWEPEIWETHHSTTCFRPQRELAREARSLEKYAGNARPLPTSIKEKAPLQYWVL